MMQRLGKPAHAFEPEGAATCTLCAENLIGEVEWGPYSRADVTANTVRGPLVAQSRLPPDHSDPQNPTWRYRWIHGELHVLGTDLAPEHAPPSWPRRLSGQDRTDLG